MCSVQRFLAALFAVAVLVLGGLPSSMALAATTPTSDFTDNGDGTVTHKTTGLTWKRCSEGMTWTGSTCSGTAQQYTWDAAMVLGSSGWRLPTLEQLKTIIDSGNGSPTINQTVFPKTPPAGFWSATAHADSSGNAWYVYFYNGYGHNDGKAYTFHVRLVRSGQSVGTSSSSTSAGGATTPVPAASAQRFSVSATATGDITRQTLQGRVNLAPSDVGQPGAVFVVATPPGLGTYYHGQNGSWLPTVQSYFRGALAGMDVGIVENPTDLSALGGTKIYLGYTPCPAMLTAAQCYDRMVSNSGTADLALTLKGKLTITTYTQSSTNGSVAALASLTSGHAQKTTYWGLKDKSGKPYALTESLFSDPASGDQFRTIYGTHELPKKIVDLKTGTSIVIRWGMDNAEFRHYDGKRKFVLGFNMIVNGATPTFSPLSDDGRFAADPDDLTDDAEKQLRDTLSTPVTWLAQLKNKAVEKAKVLAKNTTIAVGVGFCAGNPVCTDTVIAVVAGAKGGMIALEMQNNGGKHDISQLDTDLSDSDNPIYPTERRDAYGYPILPVTKQQATSTETPTIARAPDETVAALQKLESPPAPAKPSSSPCPDGQYLSALTNLCEITPACPYGYVSDDKGYCIPPSMCTAPKVIQNGQCISPTPTPTSTSTSTSTSTASDTYWYCASPSGAWCFAFGYKQLLDSDRQRCSRGGGVVSADPGRCGR